MSDPVAIDAHQHFWSVARKDYHWMTPQSGVLLRDYGPQDLAPLLNPAPHFTKHPDAFHRRIKRSVIPVCNCPIPCSAKICQFSINFVKCGKLPPPFHIRSPFR